MRGEISENLKTEILNLPTKEKNALLIRLIKKDDLLCEQLNFRLLENESDLNDRKFILEEIIEETLKAKYTTSKQLNVALRGLNAKINRHQNVTKDKYGEVEFTLKMLNTAFANHKKLFEYMFGRNEKLCKYVVQRTESIYKKAKNLHEDIQFDFKNDFDVLLKNIYKFETKNIAKEKNLINEF